jgi:hypothetical protein
MRLAGAALMLLVAGAARGDERVHLHAGGGGHLASEAPHTGFWLTAGLQAPGRWGGRVDVLDDGERGLWEGSVTYQLAATRPRLVIAFHAGGGWARAERAATLAVGVATQLGIIGPLALGFDASAHATLEERPRFPLTGTAGILLAW